jgi:hypothetical protein
MTIDILIPCWWHRIILTQIKNDEGTDYTERGTAATFIMIINGFRTG